MRGKWILYGVIAVIAIGVGLFTVSSKDVLRYNDTTVGLLKQMNTAFNGYDERITTYCQGKKVDLAQLQQEVSKIDTAVKQAQDKLKSLKVPDDDLCRTFQKEITGYVDCSARICDQYRKVNEYVGAHLQPTEADAMHVVAMLKPSADDEEKAMKSLSAAQEQMAKKFKIKLQ